MAIYSAAGKVVDRVRYPPAGQTWASAQPRTNAARALGMVCGRTPWAPGPIQADLRGGLPTYRRMLADSEAAFIADAFDSPDAAAPFAGQALNELKVDFPELWQAIRSAALDDARSGQPDSVLMAHAMTLENQFVLAHISDIARAPDDVLLSYVAAQAAMLQAMRQVDPAVCAALASGVQPPAAAAAATVGPASAAFNATAFRTIRAGIDHPATRGPLQANDARDLASQMQAIGEPRDLIAATFSAGGVQSRTPAEQCDMSIDLDLALGKLPPEQGARLAGALQAAAAKVLAQRQSAAAPTGSARTAVDGTAGVM